MLTLGYLALTICTQHIYSLWSVTLGICIIRYSYFPLKERGNARRNGCIKIIWWNSEIQISAMAPNPELPMELGCLRSNLSDQVILI